MTRRRLSQCGVAGAVTAFVCLLPAAEMPASAPPAMGKAEQYLYLPPGFADRVVYYHSFETDQETPEINRIGAVPKGAAPAPASGLNGHGYRCPTEAGQAGYALRSPALSPDRPITAMVWWRLDAPMLPETGFDVLTLNGKGLIGSFVRGKGEWCALPAPRRVFQVYYFEGITNHNDITSETILIEQPEWHHSAITIEAGTDIRVYWDGELTSFYSLRGRPFNGDDIDQLCLGPQTTGHPMTLDDVIVVDRVLRSNEIADYVVAGRRLANLGLPTCVAPQ